MNKLSIILLIMLIFSFSGCNMPNFTEEHTMQNICDAYAKQEHTKINYPEKDYEVNGLRILESRLKEDCLDKN